MITYIFIHFAIIDLAIAFVFIKTLIKQYKAKRLIAEIAKYGKEK